MIWKKNLRYVIEKIIMKKYPIITGIESISSISNSTFIDLNTSECLDSGSMVEIDSEIKKLFRVMGSGVISSFKSPVIAVFFDCGDGDGFKFISPYGYKHI